MFFIPFILGVVGTVFLLVYFQKKRYVKVDVGLGLPPAVLNFLAPFELPTNNSSETTTTTTTTTTSSTTTTSATTSNNEQTKKVSETSTATGATASNKSLKQKSPTGKELCLLPISQFKNLPVEEKTCSGFLDIQIEGKAKTKKTFYCYLQSDYFFFQKSTFISDEQFQVIWLKGCVVRRITKRETESIEYCDAIEIMHPTKQICAKKYYIFLWAKSKAESDKWMGALRNICPRPYGQFFRSIPLLEEDVASSVPAPALAQAISSAPTPALAQAISSAPAPASASALALALATSSTPSPSVDCTIFESKPSAPSAATSASSQQVTNSGRQFPLIFKEKREKIRASINMFIAEKKANITNTEQVVHGRTRLTEWSTPYDQLIHKDIDDILLPDQLGTTAMTCKGWLKLQKGESNAPSCQKVSRYCILRGKRLLHFASERVMSPREYGDILLQDCTIEPDPQNDRVIILQHTKSIVFGANRLYLVAANDNIRGLWLKAILKNVMSLNLPIEMVHDTPSHMANFETTKWLKNLTWRMFESVVSAPDIRERMKRFLKSKIESKMEEENLDDMKERITVDDVEVPEHPPEMTSVRCLNSEKGTFMAEFGIEFNDKLKIVILARMPLSLQVRFEVVIASFIGKMIVHISQHPFNRVSICFQETPTIDFVVETTVGFKNLQLQSVIIKRIKAALAERVVMPNRVCIDLPDSLSHNRDQY